MKPLRPPILLLPGPLLTAVVLAALWLGPSPATFAAEPQDVLQAALMVEAEDFQPVRAGAAGGAPGWHVVRYSQGNYMVDSIGYNHVSGERLLSAAAGTSGARARAVVVIPQAGTYRVWSRFEQPTGTDNRFVVQVRQHGKLLGSALMGERDAPKYFFGQATPVAQADPSWGSEGLVEQPFDVADLQAGPAEITLVAPPAAPIDSVGDRAAPGRVADRNIDLLYLTRDLTDAWRKNSPSGMYPILDAALAAAPARYVLRVTSDAAQDLDVTYLANRSPWYPSEGRLKLSAGVPGPWLPLRRQDVCHFTTLVLHGQKGVALHVELARPGKDPLHPRPLRALDWSDPEAGEFLIGLPPYPARGEAIVTVEEQYRSVVAYLAAHPTQIVGKDPTAPLAYGGWIPAWDRGRVGDAAAALYYDLGLRVFAGQVQPNSALPALIDNVRRRFSSWDLAPNRSVALIQYRQPPTAENIAHARQAAEQAGVLPYLQRFDYGDEIAFTEWLAPVADAELAVGFGAWQKQHPGPRPPAPGHWDRPDSSAAAAGRDPALYVESRRFYEAFAIARVAAMARSIPAELGPQVLYGANFAVHPFYYPEIARFIKWFRGGAANFGRHSEYFWQVGTPGPLINGYVAEHFRAGMRDNPQALLLQYTMPHSPGNTDDSFIRSAFTHLAHGARGLDYFGIGLNHSFTENYIDFRDPARFAAIRDVNRAMATIEDILPESQVVKSPVALILSDSTEAWDFAGIARDRAGLDVFGSAYKKTRLAYHQDRVGIYYALVHAGHPPDLLTEDDVQAGLLSGYAVAYWVGDCAEPNTVAALADWVRGGGHLVATAGALRYDPYRRPLPAGAELLGLRDATLEAQSWFFRPQIELPHLVPIDSVSWHVPWPSGPVGDLPALALWDHVTPAPGSRTSATSAAGHPAVIEHDLGRGSTTFIATLPGVAYLWSAYQPPPVPSRGPSSHWPLSHFNAAAGSLINAAAAALPPPVDAHGALIDARIVQSPRGYAVPLANYSADPQAEIELTLRAPRPIRAVRSARAGLLPSEPVGGGAVHLRYAPGLGDILRLEVE